MYVIILTSSFSFLLYRQWIILFNDWILMIDIERPLMDGWMIRGDYYSINIQNHIISEIMMTITNRDGWDQSLQWLKHNTDLLELCQLNDLCPYRHQLSKKVFLVRLLSFFQEIKNFFLTYLFIYYLILILILFNISATL